MHPRLIQTVQGPMVEMPADDAGDHELISIQAAQARVVDLLADPDCYGGDCVACALSDLLQGIR